MERGGIDTWKHGERGVEEGDLAVQHTTPQHITHGDGVFIFFSFLFSVRLRCALGGVFPFVQGGRGVLFLDFFFLVSSGFARWAGGHISLRTRYRQHVRQGSHIS